MSVRSETIPRLTENITPSSVLGVADLTTFAYQGHPSEALIKRIEQAARAHDQAASLYDRAIACQLSFQRADGLSLLNAALDRSQLYRVRHAGTQHNPLRVLALAVPGDLMTNAPLDFLTNHLNVRLDLLYIRPNQKLPEAIPDHDVALFAAGDADPPVLARLCRLYALWPRPVLNDPRFLPALARDALARSLAGVTGVCSPPAVALTRDDLQSHSASGDPIAGLDFPGGPYPCLIRPHGSHAGTGLARVDTPKDLVEYLRSSAEDAFFVTAFEDYRSPDSLYRKSRVAFIDCEPFLCHMAISSNWMVHYLNAGMTESAAKRAQEASAMAEFDTGFARRHAEAFQALHRRLGFDYYSIDCAETRDGRLLVFEADAAAIVHLMDPHEVFPYKYPQMHKVFAAFEAMLRRRAESVTPPCGLACPSDFAE